MLTKAANIAVVGAGAIGGVTAAFIEQAGYDLELVCKHRALADKINAEGLKITGIKGDCQVKMRTVAKIPDLSGPKDLVLLATKANDCVAAAQDLIPFLKPDSAVVSLQNGISEHALADVLGKERVIGCVVGWGASHYTPGELEVTSEGEFVIGAFDRRPDGRLAFIQQVLNSVNPARISNNIMGELYAKLIINACINSLGVVAGARLGRLLADKSARTIFILLMREALAVAEAMDIEVEPAAGGKLNYYTFLREGMWANIKRHLTIRLIGFRYRRIKSSSLQSIERGRRTEIDFLNGYICDHGKKHRVPTPVNDAIRKMVHEIEAGSRKMSMGNLDALVAVNG